LPCEKLDRYIIIKSCRKFCLILFLTCKKALKYAVTQVENKK
jgi:hypothetical protein